MKSENIREQLELLQKENAELKANQAEAPNWSDPSSVVNFHGAKIIHLLNLMRRETAASRLRLLNSSIDSWSRASRLANDSSELDQLKADIEALKTAIEHDSKVGIRRVQ